MLEPKPQFVVNKIIRGVVLACTTNIELLTLIAYNWLMCQSGFIAHYSRVGFINHYGCASALMSDVLEQKSWNVELNYNKGEDDYKYYRQEADMYKKICDILVCKSKIPTMKECSIMHSEEVL